MDTSNLHFSPKSILHKLKFVHGDRNPAQVWKMILAGGAFGLLGVLGFVYTINQQTVPIDGSNTARKPKLSLNEKNIQDAVRVYAVKDERFLQISTVRPTYTDPSKPIALRVPVSVPPVTPVGDVTATTTPIVVPTLTPIATSTRGKVR